MNNKEFSKMLEYRTKEFAVQVIKLSVSLPNLPDAKVIRNQITKSGSSVVQITGRLTDPEVRQISQIKSGFVRVKQARPLTGWK